MEYSVLQSLENNGSATMSRTTEASEIHQLLFEQARPTCESQFTQEPNQGDMQLLMTTKPEIFKHCKLKMERHDLAYAKPLSDPALRIKITGRDNVGKSFPDDEVCVQILSRELQAHGGELLTGKVVGLVRRDEGRCTFICKMEGFEQLVTPIRNNMTRIYVIQSEPGKIEVRKVQSNGKRWATDRFMDKTDDQLLVVKVLKWESDCKYPLGVIIDVLSRKDDLYELFQMLSKESGVKDTPPPLFQPRVDQVGDEDREDFCNDITFTVDSRDAQDLDDAISVTENGETYVVAVHITDVACYISKDSEEDLFARQQGRTFYPPPGHPSEPAFMVSRKCSECLSLVPGKKRKAISLLTVINKDTHTIESSHFTLSLVRSNRRLSYEEADRIIQKRCLDTSGPLHFSSVEDCIAAAYRFTEVHRKCRLEGGWGSGQWAKKTRAHWMVEELMILYNSAVAEKLLSDNLTRDLTPLRCHQKPDHEELKQFKTKYSNLLPLSLYLSHICEDFQEVEESSGVWTEEEDEEEEDEEEKETENIQEVAVITSVLNEMQSLAKNRDYHTLVQLITSDNIHPTLYPMAKEFQDLQNKAVIVRSCSSLLSKLGHFGLQLNVYTLASSPMRRYLDLILQRLLHSVLHGKNDVGYTKAEIDQFCDSGMESLDCEKDLVLQTLKLITSSKLSFRVVTKLAVVDQLSPNKHEFMISLPFDQESERFTIMYRHLKVIEQPRYNSVKKSNTLHWKRRVYSFSKPFTTRPQSRLKKDVTPISINKWKQMISAVKFEDWDEVKDCLQDVITAAKREPKRSTEDTRSKELQHFKEFDMELKLGEVLQVQLGTEVIKGMTTPTVKLLNIYPMFEVCLEHARNPTMCFSKEVCNPSKSVYQDYKEYQKIWHGLCQMDTAYNAVEENNSVILEDVDITWTQKAETNLQGFFQVAREQKKDWCLEFDLTNCFLCIRLRGQCVEKAKQCSGSGLEDLQDMLPFTWVAHGVATQSAGDIKKERENKSVKIRINFKINHLSMIEIPATVFEKGTRFTVEVIPKKIPCVLREQAVANIKKANSLVKSIATGNVIYEPLIKPDQLHTLDYLNLDLPPLNESQKTAVEKALQKPFTVIQGPPGTGKTVVGVHITYQFYMKNKALENDHQKQAPEPDQQIPKKCGILYCGPSNKSVDIVAEQLIKLRGVLKPLRIYCDQMEMQEFPYPGSELKLCRKSLRDEKPKEKLRDITLMYLVRKPENPYSKDIKNYEENPLEFDSERKVLKEAQKHELLKHDVVLCTCSTALNPNLIKIMDFRQILIDECAMAVEPEAFIPLVSHNPQQIVILGDHKQVQPIVTCARVKELGMQKSLFERFMERAVMLDTQYRMHKSICEFPSHEFYGGKLKTGAKRGPCLLLNNKNTPTAILFGHVQGEEVSLVVSTAAGNESSVANKLEAEQAVRVADLLIRLSGVKPEDICILTPYNAQVCAIKKVLKDKKKKKKDIEGVSVCTVMKSQGSEWPYVIVSTVRSCPLLEIRNEPNHSKAWLGKKLGFITDPNQVNVAITRAQDGLCILGNRHLLECSELWRKLLSHYQSQDCVVDPAQNIRVQDRTLNLSQPCHTRPASGDPCHRNTGLGVDADLPPRPSQTRFPFISHHKASRSASEDSVSSSRR